MNQTFAREFFGGQPPVGRHVTANNVTYEIVGVVQDSKYDLHKGIPKTVYIAWTQQGNVGGFRTARNPRASRIWRAWRMATR